MRALAIRVVLPIAMGIVTIGACADDSEQIDFFERKIRPVLVQYCYECHSSAADAVQGGLVVDHREGMQRGGDSGSIVEPGKPENSSLMEALRYESFEMPPSGRLPEDVIRDFEAWIKMGAIDPRDAPTHDLPNSKIDIEAGRLFWSFQPPTRYDLPDVDRVDWPNNRIDFFVLKRLEDSKLSPSDFAEEKALVRRVSFDLVGLPPASEMRQPIDDQSTDSFERLVDSLVASPAFGERWGRVWMDVMRYAEDQAHIVGGNRTLCYPNAYLYRDWLIGALNEDMPYDEFIRAQLAADLKDPENVELQVALGFIGLGPKYYRRNDPEVMADEWEDRIDTVSRGLLGLTVACARCHDHKFDPITTEDYYSLAGVFASTEMFNRPVSEEAEKDNSGNAKKPEDAMHLVRDAKPRDLNVMIRGDVNRLGHVAPRRFLSVLCSGEPIELTEGSGRSQLSDAIACRDNPLTARVLVNRVWAQLFGRPLVDTPSNFGSLGSRPTHPQLLDDLALRFMDSGWSIKWLVREMVLSSTYRQSNRIDEKGMKLDPQNTLLWRMPSRRLSVEQYRDALLIAAGQLDLAIGGQSTQPDDPASTRRTVYSEVSRLKVNSMLARFDFPDPNAHSAGRVETTTPLQKLFLLNGPLMVSVAEAMAGRFARDEEDVEGTIQSAYLSLYNRSATHREIAVGEKFLESGGRERLVTYFQALLASNEMFMID